MAVSLISLARKMAVDVCLAGGGWHSEGCNRGFWVRPVCMHEISDHPRQFRKHLRPSYTALRSP